MKLKAIALCTFLIFSGTFLRAQQQPADPIGENLFPPELVMQHQQALGLSEDQKKLFKEETRKAQTRFTELQWQLQDEMETMASLVKEDRVDEQHVLTQLDKVLNLEREIKRTHFALIVRMKNKLTPGQQARLQEIRSKPQPK